MNWNYLKIAWRILLKNKTHTLINIAGLGMGFSVSVLMMIFVIHQLSFDSFHENSDRIYRLTLQGSMADGKQLSAALTSGEVAQHIGEDVPEAEQSCRVYRWGISEVIHENKRFTNDLVLWVDSNFFSIFSFPLETGSPENALTEPFSLVITKSTALKYFGESNPINQTLKIRGLDYRITGLMPDPPSNSHIGFDMLASFGSLVRPGYNIVAHNGISFPTYVMMREGADFAAFNQKTTGVADHYLNERFAPYGITGKHSLQPLSRIYLHSAHDFDSFTRGDIRHVYIFSFLALAVILIAIFNFVNLVTAQSEKRMREIGMRKVMGALRKDLILQFIGESVLVAFFAFLLSLMINELFINEFASMLENQLRLEYWYRPLMFISMLLLVLLTGIVAGLYPALYLSGFQPIIVLKGLTRSSVATQFIRKTLVIFQFAISIFLITSVLLLNKQVKYMQNKDLGFSREDVVSVRGITQNIRNAYPALRAELQQHSSVISVTASQEVPGETMSFQNSRRAGDNPESSIMMYENRIQHGYFETFGIRIVKGRDFDPLMATDTAAFVINETAARMLGLDDPINEEIVIWQHTGKIIGVVSDFNYQSLHNEIDPLAFSLYDPWIGRINIRISPHNRTQTLELIKESLETADPNYTFEYFYIDDLFARMYTREEHLNKITMAAAFIAIIISFMGLYALTSFTIRKRIREIAIRKTLGASLKQILGILFSDMWRWMVIGSLIAWPLAAWVIIHWQQNFAFRISIAGHWYLFLASGVLAALVGTAATLSQAWAASKTHPAQSLKAD